MRKFKIRVFSQLIGLSPAARPKKKSRELKGPTAQGLICKQTALRTEHDSKAKNRINRKQAHSGEGLAAIYKDVLKKYCKKSISN